jgi:F-type H+-transporting ATPase subunit delta
MTNTGIASRYAEALVEALIANQSANPSDDPHVILSGLNDFVAALSESRDLDLVLVSPSVSAERKRAVIAALSDRLGIHRLVRNFLFVLSDHRRLMLVREANQVAGVVLDEKLGFQRAVLTIASPLSEDEKNQIAGKLGEITGKRIRLNLELDLSLVGGVVARVGSTVYDGSVRGQLEAIGSRLAAG